MKKYKLEVVVFLCGAIVMVLEIVGSRIIAPYLGTSIIVWTSLIGVIMGALSLGYWWGGKLADIRPNYEKFSFIIFLSAIFTLIITFSEKLLVYSNKLLLANLYAGTIIAASLLFLAPSFLLGMVSPYAARLRLKDLQTSGATVGRLYAISTGGSIVGTFLAGFVLLPWLGCMRIVVILSICLFLVSIFIHPKNFLLPKLFLLTFVLVEFLTMSFSQPTLGRNQTISIDTLYHHAVIRQTTDKKTGRAIRTLSFEPLGIQSAVFLDSNDLVFEYSKFYNLADFFHPENERALLLGGAAFAYPRYFLATHLKAEMDVVEIDPAMHEIAKQYFQLTDNPRLHVYNEDARLFLNNVSVSSYDVVYGDAFSSQLSIPYQLATKETVAKIYESLKKGGVAILNIVSAIEGEQGMFLRAEYRTYKSIFPQVYIFQVNKSDQPNKVQNVILVAIKNSQLPNFNNLENKEYLQNLWQAEIAEDMPIITDDYAPVDYYASKMF
ncbi:MAG: fused MFS/spermidine synthase [Candidatus Falkowbacteria bacterium]|nr:fused MFS/spermidine synthase [Candidatus Falkowbacteria bacterium]